MLLETDTCVCRSAYATASSVSEDSQDADDFRSDARCHIDRLYAEDGAPELPLLMWLVGLEMRTSDGLPVWRYYVVNDVADTCRARLAALRRANDSAERATWGRSGLIGRVERIEVQQILQDEIGNVTLECHA